MKTGAKVILAATVPLVLAIGVVMFIVHYNLNEQIDIQTETVRKHEDAQRKARLVEFVRIGQRLISSHCTTFSKKEPTDSQLDKLSDQLNLLPTATDYYYFIYDAKGNILVHPSKTKLIKENSRRTGEPNNKNFMAYADINHKLVIKSLLLTARHNYRIQLNDSPQIDPTLAKFVEYEWPQPTDVYEGEAAKLGYAVMMPACEWMIGSGFYLEKEEKTRARLSQAVATQMTSTRNQILAVAAAALALAIVVAYGLRLNQLDLRHASEEVEKATNELRLRFVELEVAERKLTAANDALQTANDELRVLNRQKEVSNNALVGANERQKSMQMQVLQSLEKERERIAGALHDGLVQSLASVKFIFESGLVNAKHGKGNLVETVNHGVLQIMGCMNEARGLSENLYPSEIIDLGLSDALKQLVRMFKARTGAMVLDKIDSPLPKMERHKATALFRFVQGGLLHIERQAASELDQLRLITVDLKFVFEGDGLHIRLDSVGDGLEDQEIVQRRSNDLDLDIMRFSIEMLGGTIKVLQRKQGSMELHAHLPNLQKPL